MVHHLDGELIVLGPSRAVIETGGLGFELRIPLSTYRALKGQEGKRVHLLAHLQVLEDDLRLYGFAREEERTLFRLALSVSGVGPATGLALLASFDPAGFAQAVVRGDSRSLQKVKGVGPKLSQRLVLELRDRTTELAVLSRAARGAAAGAVEARAAEETVLAEAAAALVELGFVRREAEAKVRGAVERLLASAPPAADPASAPLPPGGSGKGQPPGPGEERHPPAAPRPPLSVEAVIQAALRGRG